MLWSLHPPHTSWLHKQCQSKVVLLAGKRGAPEPLSAGESRISPKPPAAEDKGNICSFPRTAGAGAGLEPGGAALAQTATWALLLQESRHSALNSGLTETCRAFRGTGEAHQFTSELQHSGSLCIFLGGKANSVGHGRVISF